MATEDQGIMSLPQGGQEGAPGLTLEDSHDAVMQGLQNASPDASAALQQTMQGLTAQLDQLSDEELDTVLQAIQYLYQGGEKEYAKRLQEIISSGLLDAGDLPEEFDPEVLTAIGTVMLQAKQQRQMGNQREEAMQPPAQFARGGIANAARIAAKGRSGDTMLAHINADEAKLLRKHGGSATINPSTGLVEYSWLSKALRGVGNAVSSVVKGVVNTVKSIVKSPIGKILGTVALATFLGPAGMNLMASNAALGVASGATTLLAGGNLKQALISGATAFFGAPGGAVSNFVGGAVSNAAANAAISAGIVGTGAGLLSGQKLADAVKSGLTAGAIGGLSTGIQQGFGNRLELAKAPVFEGTPAPGQIPPGVMAGSNEAFEAAMKGLPPSPTQAGNAASNEAFEAAMKGLPPGQAGVQTTVAGQPATLSKVPTIGESLGNIGGGLSDLVQGKEGAFGRITGGIGDLFSPTKLTDNQLMSTPEYQKYREAGFSAPEALKKAADALNPGLIRSYAPMAAAGLGVAGAMGGFKPTPLGSSALAERLAGSPSDELIRSNPKKYIPQGLRGVEYDDQGNIVGSKPWTPTIPMEDIRVPAQQAGIGSLPALGSPVYTPSIGSLGAGSQIAQPYNTPNMYSNLMPPMGYPRYAADGGMIEEPVQHMSLGGMLQSLFDKIREKGFLGLKPQAATPAPVTTGSSAAPAPAAPMPVAQAPAGPTPEEQQQQAALARRQALAAQFAQGLRYNQATPISPAMGPYYNLASPTSFFADGGYAMGGSMNPNSPLQAPMMAVGGLASLAQGGYPRRTGQISGPGTEKSDSIPAMLSDGEFVMTAKAVRGAGKGDRRAGAKKMYALMHQLERNASRG